MEKMKNIGGDMETLVLFVNEKFDEMGENRSFIGLFLFLNVRIFYSLPSLGSSGVKTDFQ